MQLTTRQKVEQMTAKGKSPREIARKLDISTQAVHYHLKASKEGKPSNHSSRSSGLKPS